MTDLKRRLLSMAHHDKDTARQILERGNLEDTYHAELEAIHIANARQLEEIITTHGLPGKSLVDEDGGEATWLIVQHAISLPDFQRKCLPLFRDACAKGEFPAAYAAYLEDRIRFFEARPQRYGTHYDWNDEGQLVPYMIEDVDTVDALRASVGLSSVEKNTSQMRSNSSKPPKDYAAKRSAYEAWLTKVGWR